MKKSCLTSRAFVAVSLVVSVVACSKPAPAPVAALPTAAPQIVYLVVTPTALPEVATFTLIPTAAPTPTFQTGEQTFSLVPTRAPTVVDIASIPNSDRERAAGPKTLHEQMERCLSFTVSVGDYGSVTTRHPVRVTVHARNSCDVSFAGEDRWVEVRARDRTKGVVARETGHFQEPIRSHGEGETFMELMIDSGDTLEASPWWAAGGGKKAGQ